MLANIEINDQFKKALDLIENSEKHLFITGRAGTGKSTLLEYFRTITKKKLAVLAPTGVAALNVRGQTIHSFFGFMPDITVEAIKKYAGRKSELYKKIDTIIIDEISMVRADLLDCVDLFLRLNSNYRTKPFGGIQMIFIGDLYQLPPVVTSKEKDIFRSHYNSQYFFDAKSFNNLDIEFIELEKIYRQNDQEFINLLNAIRNNSVTEEELKKLNKRLNPDFEAHQDDFYINLTTTNALSSEINEKEIAKLETPLFIFEGKIAGDFDKNHLPTDIILKLKEGSQIMMLNNDTSRRWVNGTVGKIIKIIKKPNNKHIVIAKLTNGKTVAVKLHTWEIFKLYYNKATNTLDSETIGSFTQYPIKLAWAVTIHKGQGKTFDKVIVDIGKGTFSHGQVYVALSRCTTLDGLILKKPIQKKHIFMDWKVVKFLTGFQYNISEKMLSTEEKINLIKTAIKNKSNLEIVYLKSNDEKSRREIQPKKVGKMDYIGKQYIGVEAYCHKRKDDRVFRVDRILEIKEL